MEVIDRDAFVIQDERGKIITVGQTETKVEQEMEKGRRHLVPDGSLTS